MLRRCSASVFVLISLVVSFCSAADWPTYLCNNARVGAIPENLDTPLKLQWVYTAPAPPEMAWSGPRSTPIEGHVMLHRVAYDRAIDVAVVGPWLYFGSSVDHKVYCVNARTGEPRWHFFTDGPIRLSPTVWEGKVYVGSDDGVVYCLDAQDGRIVWKLRVGPTDERLLARGRMISRWPVRTGVLVDGGVAYFGAGVFPHETVYLCAADANTGQIIWRNDRISQEDAGRNELSPQGYLLCDEDQLFVPSARSLPTSFRRDNGEQIFKRSHSWRTTAGGVVGGYKAVLADGQIYASGTDHFLALDEERGNVGFAWISGRQLCIAQEKGFVATGKAISGLDRLRHAKATIERQQLYLKQYDLRRNRSDVDRDEYDRQIRQLDEQMAQLSEVGVLWSVPSELDASLIVAGDLVFAGGPGRVIALNARNGNQVWTAEVDGLASGLAAANGCLFVSTDQGKIYGFADAVTASDVEVASYPKTRTANPYADSQLTDLYAAAAEQIINTTGVTRGYCLVVGSERGQLAYELAKRSQLRIYGIEPDAKKAAEARDRLDAAGLHGSQITIVHGDPAKMPFSNYFANLIVSDALLLTGQLPGDPAEISRCLKPVGGAICLRGRADDKDGSVAGAMEKIAETLPNVEPAERAEVPGASTVESTKETATLTRGTLPGAGDWSHQYGDAANTAMSQDYLVKGGMSVLWYGDPGPASMVNRHEGAAAPLSTNGRMFIQGINSVLCYDAYNGLYLWEFQNPGALRTGVFNNEETSNLAASDDTLFVAVNDTCTAIDAATGQVRTVYKVPQSADQIARVWGYVGYYKGLLVGTSTIRKELAQSLRRRGHTVDNETDAVFAIDVRTGNTLWTYHGKNILHVTIAIGDDRVIFIDSSITQQQRESLLREDKSQLRDLSPEEAKKKEAELKQLDVRLAVAIDAYTGKPLWSKPVDVTNCSRVGIGGGQLTLIYHNGHVLICGANANGHYWRQFLSGEFKERRLIVLDAQTGNKLWAKNANYRHRPIVVENLVVAEPWAFDLHTGQERKRENPLTGELTTWQFSRPGHHCGMLTATPHTLFFRSGFTGYYDLDSDSGTSHFAGHRTGCWINVIPGNGLLMIPEASAGCVCQFSIASTVVLEPRVGRDTWRVYSATGGMTPVKHLALNFGAPGDRRDAFGTLWLAYPRPNTVGRLEYDFDLKTTFAKGGGYFSRNSESLNIQRADTPWVFTTGASGLTRCELPLLGKDDKPATYEVTMYFAEIDVQQPGERVFDIKLQGTTVDEQFDILKEADGPNRKLVRKFSGIDVKDNLTVEFLPRSTQLPILAAIEVHRVD